MSRARNRADANAPDDSITSADLAPDIVLTGGSVGIPSVTTANRPGESGGTNASQTATVGMIIYNSTIGIMQQYAASGWASIDSPPTVSSLNYPGDDTALDVVGEYNDATCDYNNDPTIAHDANSNMKIGMSVSGTGIPAGATIASVTSTTAFELSASTTGGAVTNGTLTFNTQTLIITGNNFSVGVTVTIDGTAPSTVTRNSITQITVTGTPAKTAGTKVNGLVVTNTNSLAGSINIDYSPLPGWTTSSGNLLTSYAGTTISTIDLVATGEAPITYAITSGALPTGLSMATDDGDITGTMSGSSATYNFTVNATDAEAQSSPRLFNIIIASLPTGGDITTYTGFRVHTFISNGTFTLSAATTCSILIVAGGGGGASGSGGGGGGGAVLYGASIALDARDYTIVRGGGGAAGSSSGAGVVGGDSTFTPDGGSVLTITAKGGGGGNAEGEDAAVIGANSGGGTEGYPPNTPPSHAAFTGYTVDAENVGGNSNAGLLWDIMGGGAGANGAGGTATDTTGGAGGVGVQVGTIYDGSTNHYWAGGGGGSAWYAHNGGNGGLGGGGGGSTNTGTQGTGGGSAFNTGTAGTTGGAPNGGPAGNNTGGGGGGGGESTGGSGGSGIVILRYAA